MPTDVQGTAVIGREMLQPPSLDETRNGAEHPPDAPAIEEKVYKVLVGIPLKGNTPAQSYHARMLMWKHLGGQEAVDFYEHKSPRYVFSLGAIGEILVPFARERLADSVVESGSDYLFMVDDDMIAPEDLFYKLVAHNKDICAALAFTRNPDHKPVIYQEIAGFDPVTQKTFSLPKFVLNYPRNKLVQCDAVGFGAVLIKAEVLKKVPKPWFFGMEGTGEDVAFCYKARKVGCEVWMDTSIKLGHLGAPVVVTEDYSDAWNGLNAEQRDKMYGPYLKYQKDGTL
jgi:hypothetical protein